MSGGRPLVGVLDYGSGNLHSVCRALDAAGAQVRLSASPIALEGCRGLVVPGVGAFAACMNQLEAGPGVDFVRSWAAAARPLLGICVGHQVLFTSGDEHGRVSAGIGVFTGAVTELASRRLPHMGWNTVERAPGSRLLEGLGQERFYFVHSYGVRTAPPGALTSWVEHDGDRFVAAVERGPVCSTQFHPEKSGRAGARLLGNWLAIAEQA
ncbi:imidazole glycerol phosphate synthase subunit HisH [uncultured Propionibacterium sp.]|uniref:imidazole glycerol phosphate synthase subunit HisH n=1 Tax=uncultured Propionibacterium sp. TaxID=218066 RepID=UPI00292F8837|nr:imidazole glycerol phosphate synthase subunit HisH [uncultured Propionibacterium sp.]